MPTTPVGLQAKGYSVRATVRSKADSDKVGHLERLAAALPGESGAGGPRGLPAPSNLHGAVKMDAWALGRAWAAVPASEGALPAVLLLRRAARTVAPPPPSRLAGAGGGRPAGRGRL